MARVAKEMSRFSVYLPSTLVEAFKKECTHQKRSMSNLLHILISDFLALKEEQENKTKKAG